MFTELIANLRKSIPAQVHRNDEGEYHCVFGPAVLYGNGDYEWYYNGKNHRQDGGPAYRRGTVAIWYINGNRHRDNDLPARISLEHGVAQQIWYQEGRIHRINGPAWIEDSAHEHSEMWYERNRLHRDGAPAIMIHTGNPQETLRLEWWTHGRLVHTEARNRMHCLRVMKKRWA